MNALNANRQCSRRWLLCGTICVLGSLTGCPDSGPPIVPVKGVLTLNDEPLSGISIGFHPDTEAGNEYPGFIPAGVTDESGKYELTTTSRAGAPPGWYKIVLSPPSATPTGGEAPKAEEPQFDKKYTALNTTDLTVEVKVGLTPGAYDLILSD